ncbi:CoxG family protein [Nocardioides sp. GCM10027113]|uniref:CoxG family protein n=1 Tax=unclassified Nocardioides TaxID=2615069 RepID=UPI003609308A
MARFTATTRSDAVVEVDRQRIWETLTDPAMLPRLTPYLDHIEVHGDHWRWEMSHLPVLHVSIAPSFTERMTFVEGRRIEFTHDPPAGRREHAGAEGHYDLEDVEGGTRLRIELELGVDLALPRLAAPAVNRVMQAVIDAMGHRFSHNLLRHLG